MVKKHGLEDRAYPSSDGLCSYFEARPGSEAFCIVTIGSMKGRDWEFVMALLVHEAVHCFQFMCAEIGEDEPSSEFQAYMVQYISAFLFKAYKETRHGEETEEAVN